MPDQDLLATDNFHPDVREEAAEHGRYVMYSVFSVSRGQLAKNRAGIADELVSFIVDLNNSDVIVRGVYDLAGFHADADVLIWWHAKTPDALQDAYRSFLANTSLGKASEPVWSAVGVHRPNQQDNTHIPSFVGGHSPDEWLTVYPFVRSYQWYILNPDERARMLRDHGMQAVGYDDIHASTTAAFGMGDYEWLLSFEAPELERITNMLLKMRYVEARTHVRLETPMYSGHLVSDSTENLRKFVSALR